MEKVFFDERQVKITDKRFINENVVIPISAIVSVRLDKGSIQSGVSGWPLILIAFPLTYFLVFGHYVYALLNFFAALGYLYYWSSQNKSTDFFTIFVSTSGGDKQAVVSDDLEFTKSVFSVLNDVIINRE